jgi:transcriptional regulator with XRE-family HTH domain
MRNAALITLALQELKCNQTELAEKLEVSKVQVSKWKNDENMSWDVEQKITKLIKAEGLNPKFILMAGSLEDARKWEKLIVFLGDFAVDACENNIECERLLHEPEILTRNVFDLFSAIGVEIPKPFPIELDIDGNYDDWLSGDDNESTERRDLILHQNPYSSFIYKLFLSLTDVNAFYSTYMFDHIYRANGIKVGEYIDDYLLELAATKMVVNKKFAPKFNTFVAKTKADIEEWIVEFKEELSNAGKPLEVEYMDLLTKSGHQLSIDVERVELGFSHRIHPDIYMDELLTNSRRLAKVLPLILEKLGIKEEDDDREYTRKEITESILFPSKPKNKKGPLSN